MKTMINKFSDIPTNNIEAREGLIRVIMKLFQLK